MSPEIAALFRLFIWALIVAVFLRALLSWFPLDPRNPFYQFIVRVTEPLLSPVRNLLPRTGFIDFSAMIVLIFLYLMLQVVDRLEAG